MCGTGYCCYLSSFYEFQETKGAKGNKGLQLYVFFLEVTWACCCSGAKQCPTLCDPMNCSTPGFPVLHYLSKLAQTHVLESVMPSNHPILCCPLLLLLSIFPSIRVLSNELALHVSWASKGLKLVGKKSVLTQAVDTGVGQGKFFAIFFMFWLQCLLAM